MRALWIEMKGGNEVSPKMGSRPVRALWIEIQLSRREFGERLSRPVRALWIEMPEKFSDSEREAVEAREGLVD